MHRMGQDKTWTTLFGPKVFQVGASGNDGVGGLRHAGEVADKKAVGKTKSKGNVARVRIQFGC